jgi:hypothetical protein
MRKCALVSTNYFLIKLNHCPPRHFFKYMNTIHVVLVQWEAIINFFNVGHTV